MPSFQPFALNSPARCTWQRRTLRFKHRVRIAQPARSNKTRESRANNKVSGNPNQRNHGQQNRQPQFRALQRRRPF